MTYKMSDEKKFRKSKILVVVIGGMAIGFAYLSKVLPSTILEAVLSIRQVFMKDATDSMIGRISEPQYDWLRVPSFQHQYENPLKFDCRWTDIWDFHFRLWFASGPLDFGPIL